MPICAVFGAVFLGSMLYFLLAPLFLRRALLERFDRDLFTTAYWQSIEEVLPFYGYRRAMIYLGALGFPVIARRRFPGYDFDPRSTPGLRLASWIYVAILIGSLTLAAYEFVIGVKC